MKPSIAKAQSEALKSGFLDTVGESAVDFAIVDNLLNQYGAYFLSELEKNYNSRKVAASGNILKKARLEREDANGAFILRLYLPDYYDYPNEGVKGVRSSRNAPNSPYQYKHYGMSAEGRDSIKKYIQSGRAKIRTVRNDKALGIGMERKGLNVSRKPLIDQQVATLIYMIKKYGIKTTNYFTDAFELAFKDMSVTMAQGLGREVVLTLKRGLK